MGLGLTFNRKFTEKGKHPFDQIEWEERDVKITDYDGEVIFEQKGVEVPKQWSQLATDIVASKYFRRDGVPETKREVSAKQLITRIARSISKSGWIQNGYFKTKEDVEVFQDELTHILINQYAAFNSPVQFNCGLWHEYGIEGNKGNYYYCQVEKTVKESPGYEHPQNSACFIQSVDDTIDSMVDLQKSEIKLFKHGSGTGTNFSPIRAAGEPLSSGGQGSGVISFLRGFDTWAGSIKSGGTTRRSAKMVILDIDHPEIEDFINWKSQEEDKAKALIDAGYDSNFNGDAYRTVSGQNSNNSVRVTDNFMKAYDRDLLWRTTYRTSGEVAKTYSACDLMDKIAESAWRCADPGIQFDDTINQWHTCKETGRINASNPCSEFLFLDNTACNLASINLIKFVDNDGTFDVIKFGHVVNILITAMDIIVDMSSYPTKEIAQNSHEYRPLGLGYANLGAMLMKFGIPYDSDKARYVAANITSLLTGYGYYTSTELAKAKSPFVGYQWNHKSMLEVMEMHKDANLPLDPVMTIHDDQKIKFTRLPLKLWQDVIELGEKYGYRNSQISVIAPTGTIAFMMDCDTTGIEPDFSLVKYKQLAGGGNLKIVNESVRPALENLLYSDEEINEIEEFILEKGTIENAPYVRTVNYPIFDTAVGLPGSKQVIDYMAHVKMLAAVQPFVSGGISKTVNLPQYVTKQDIKSLYYEAWKMGVKCLAVYRDGCKDSQPLNVAEEENKMEQETDQICPQRKRLPDTRKAVAHKFAVGGREGYIHVGLYEDGQPGELFIRMNKEGGTLSGTLDVVGTLVSLCLQNGIALEDLINKFKNTNFPPSGFTINEDIPEASSVIDYIFSWLEKEFGVEELHKNEIRNRRTSRAITGSR